jgi:hypothetical protein
MIHARRGRNRDSFETHFQILMFHYLFSLIKFGKPKKGESLYVSAGKMILIISVIKRKTN